MVVPNQHPALLFAEDCFRGTKRRARLDVYDAAGPACWGLCLFDPVTELCCRRRGFLYTPRLSLSYAGNGHGVPSGTPASLPSRPDTQWRNTLERGTRIHGADSLHSPTASTAWPLSWGPNRRPTTFGGDSAGTFPAGSETAACCTGAGYGLAFLCASSS